MENNKKIEEKTQGVDTQVVKEKKVAIGYTVSSIGAMTERLKTAKLITPEEFNQLAELSEKIAVRYVLKKTV